MPFGLAIPGPAVVLLSIATIVFLFVGLALVCDDFLVPSLERLVKCWGIPHNVAAATFLAFGSSAPEICINCVATYHDHVNMSVGAILGSGLIAFTVIPAASVFVSKEQQLELQIGPLLRDIVFYTISVIAFVFFVIDWSMGAGEMLFLILVFILYITVMACLRSEPDNVNDDNVNDEGLGLTKVKVEVKPWIATAGVESGQQRRLVVHPSYGVNPPAEPEEEEENQGCLCSLVNLMNMPFELLFRCTIPAVSDENVAQPLWPLSLVMSLLWVTLLSDAVLQCTVVFADGIGLSRSVAGLTVLALGAQIPDLFASMSVARAGEGPSAVANAIGSQVINICIGMALPFLIYAIVNGHGIAVKPKSTPSHGIMILGGFLTVIVVVFCALCFRHLFRAPSPRLNTTDSYILLLFYVGCLCSVVAMHELTPPHAEST